MRKAFVNHGTITLIKLKELLHSLQPNGENVVMR